MIGSFTGDWIVYNAPHTMYYFLKILGPFTGTGLLVAIGLGYMVEGQKWFGEHLLFGLFASLASILTLVMFLFYFIATGSTVKEAAIKKVIDIKLYRQSRKFKGKLFPWISITILILMVSPIMGAAYDAGKTPIWIHEAISIVACGLYLLTLIKVGAKIPENQGIYVEAVMELDKEEREQTKINPGNPSDDQTTQT
ncbi:hypothetical protein MNBD_NITROSPINAE02-320 [hydrothermal vent metagenome]|uniref:Uncharacterized protein n=1 Tax=hydrothermal vent metagenome TaxID=652676 RepID=A0A3B1C013_9ZZZZ